MKPNMQMEHASVNHLSPFCTANCEMSHTYSYHMPYECDLISSFHVFDHQITKLPSMISRSTKLNMNSFSAGQVSFKAI